MTLKSRFTSLSIIDKSTFKRWSGFILTFLAGQSLLQILQALIGFILIRWLSIEEYAQYSLAFAFQNTAQGLVEFGFSGAIIALLGKRIHKKEVLGNYIKAGRFYRNRSFVIIGVAIVILFPILTAEHNWPLHVTIFLLLSILSNLFFSGNVSYYSPPLKIHKQFKAIYRISIGTQLLRFGMIGFFYILNALNAWLAAFSNSIMTVLNGYFFKRRSQEYVTEPKHSNPEVRKEMLDYIKPIIPGILFASIQAQVTIFIISIFGSTENIAEVGALGRLGQLYTILTLSASTLVSPYFARQNNKGLFGKYVLILLPYFAIISTAVFIGYTFPNLFFLILGEKYDHLNAELVILLSLSGLNVLNGVLWAMNASRKWIYNWMPIVSISGTLLVQLIAAMTLNLSSTYNVLLFSLYTSIFVLFTRFLVSFVGFKKSLYAKS